eukprot:TRINITY_DN2987_c1_g1_i1.p2 TRINITY_DN2987_c1_g1~~TRINITY_DN2987_c1_g1_i1.p2  ORF type:complete len:199 (+),score=-4.21 TRINITY_DN2987_c1_g1_i1:377-973(+)
MILTCQIQHRIERSQTVPKSLETSFQVQLSKVKLKRTTTNSKNLLAQLQLPDGVNYVFKTQRCQPLLNLPNLQNQIDSVSDTSLRDIRYELSVKSYLQVRFSQTLTPTRLSPNPKPNPMSPQIAQRYFVAPQPLKKHIFEILKTTNFGGFGGRAQTGKYGNNNKFVVDRLLPFLDFYVYPDFLQIFQFFVPLLVLTRQ